MLKFTPVNEELTEIWLDPDRFIGYKYVDPSEKMSELIIQKTDQDKPWTIIVCEHGVREGVRETPEVIEKMVKDYYENLVSRS